MHGALEGGGQQDAAQDAGVPAKGHKADAAGGPGAPVEGGAGGGHFWRVEVDGAW